MFDPDGTEDHDVQRPDRYVFVGNEQPFCMDVRRSESGAIEPVIELVECGVRLSVSPTALDDGSIEFALGLRTTEIGRVELANLPPLDPTSREGTTVQIPRVAMESVDLSLSLEDGRLGRCRAEDFRSAGDEQRGRGEGLP